MPQPEAAFCPIVGLHSCPFQQWGRYKTRFGQGQAAPLLRRGSLLFPLNRETTLVVHRPGGPPRQQGSETLRGRRPLSSPRKNSYQRRGEAAALVVRTGAPPGAGAERSRTLPLTAASPLPRSVCCKQHENWPLVQSGDFFFALVVGTVSCPPASLYSARGGRLPWQRIPGSNAETRTRFRGQCRSSGGM